MRNSTKLLYLSTDSKYTTQLSLPQLLPPPAASTQSPTHPPTHAPNHSLGRSFTQVSLLVGLLGLGAGVFAAASRILPSRLYSVLPPSLAMRVLALALALVLVLVLVLALALVLVLHRTSSRNITIGR